MATDAPTAPQALVTAAEYLATTYRPDRDFLDGVLQERHPAEQPHARLHAIVGAVLDTRRYDWNIRTLMSQRVQITADRFRVPDLCILRRSDPKIPSSASPRSSASRSSPKTIRSVSSRAA